jgi:hypothetical protein
MKIGWFEALMTPFEVIQNDFEMMDLEAEYGQKKPEVPRPKAGMRHANPH